MNGLKPRKVPANIVKLKELKPKGGDFTDLRVKRVLGANGSTACVFIPQDFIHELKWEPRKTEIYLTVTEKGELVVTMAPEKTAKAS